MGNLYSFRENTLHVLQQEGRNQGMRRPLVTEMVTTLLAKLSSWNVVNCCTFRECEQNILRTSTEAEFFPHGVHVCVTPC